MIPRPFPTDSEALTYVVSREAGLKAVPSKVPEAFLELNEKVYNAEFDKVKALIL